MGTVLAICLLIGVCGLIAYVGDLLGRRMGKRRLSLWGLRPRHTAVLFTVVTGMLIAVFSLFVLVGLSDGIRRAVLHGEALLRENRSLRRDNLAQLRDKFDLHNQVREQQVENERLLALEKTLNADVASMETLLDRRGKRNKALHKEQRRLEAQITSLTATQDQLEKRERQLLARHQDLRENYNTTKAQLGGAHVQLRVVRADLERTQVRLANAREMRRRQLVDQAGSHVARLRARELELADERIIARANEELNRVVLSAGPDRQAVRDMVESVMRRAEGEVRKRHTAAGETALPRRLVVWQPRWAAPSDIVTTLVNWIEARGETLVLRAVADENAVAGSTVTLRLSTTPRRLAFRPGEEIAAATLDGRQSEGELLRSLVAFLQGSVRQRALRRSVLPAGDGRVGEIPYEPLLSTIKQVREVAGPARVSAVAASEIRSEGPLQLDFKVVRWESRVSDAP